MRPLWDGRPDVWDGTGKGSIGKQARSPMGCEGRASKLVGRRWWRTEGGHAGGSGGGRGVTRACVTHSDAPAVCRARMVAGWRDMDEEVAQWSVPCRWALPID